MCGVYYVCAEDSFKFYHEECCELEKIWNDESLETFIVEDWEWTPQAARGWKDKVNISSFTCTYSVRI